jgi:hypothetical protein
MDFASTAQKDKRWLVQHSPDGLFYVNQAVQFGVRPGAGICGAVLEPVHDILLASGIGPIWRWVDDFIFLNQPVPTSPVATPSPTTIQLSMHTQYFWLPNVTVLFDTPHAIARTAHPIKITEAKAMSLRDEGTEVRAWKYGYTIEDITTVINNLGVCWALQKWLALAFEQVYIGFPTARYIARN